MECKICEFKCSKQSDLNKHWETKIHNLIKKKTEEFEIKLEEANLAGIGYSYFKEKINCEMKYEMVSVPFLRSIKKQKTEENSLTIPVKFEDLLQQENASSNSIKHLNKKRERNTKTAKNELF
jgi:hypothetical protein